VKKEKGKKAGKDANDKKIGGGPNCNGHDSKWQETQVKR
jgi:hypothetical protein